MRTREGRGPWWVGPPAPDAGDGRPGAGRRLSDLVIPHCTYTDPEVGQVGIAPAAAAKRGITLDVHRLELAKVERAMIDGEADGFAALYTHNRSSSGRRSWRPTRITAYCL